MKSLVVCGTGVAAALAIVASAGGCGNGGTLSGSGGSNTGAGGQAGYVIIVGTGGSQPSGTGSGNTGGCNCCDIAIPTTRLNPDIMIVLDTSTSMNDPIDGSTSKWAASVAAITSVEAATYPTVNWGLAFMASSTDACDTGGVVAPVGSWYSAVNNALAVRTTRGGLSGGGRRPTRAAVNLAAAYLTGRNSAGPDVILLITDGAPECMPGATDVLADDAAGTERAVTAALQAGIYTFVVGLATGAGPADATLSELAVSGGLPRAASPSYFPAASAAEIATAMNQLVADVGDCTFAVPDPPTNDGTSSRGNIRVVSGGSPISPDAANGWTYTDGTMRGVQLHGTACDAVRGGGPEISIVFSCHPGP